LFFSEFILINKYKFFLKSRVTPAESSATKRKSEHAGSANKQQKTKSIRKLQNGSAYGVEVSQVILGEDSSGMGDNEIQNGVDDE
jgi:hypothetical protein